MFNLIKNQYDISHHHRKSFIIEKKKDLFYIYQQKLSKTAQNYINFIIEANKYYKINDFSTLSISLKFKNKSNNINILDKINNCKKKIKQLQIFHFTKEHNKKIIDIEILPSYYVLVPHTCFHKENELVTTAINNGTKSMIEYLNNTSDDNYIYNKLIFRYGATNEYRRKFDKLYSNNNLFDIKCSRDYPENFMPFTEQRKFKYLIDIHGLSGHSGRRFWMFHFNRVLFLPIDDSNKLFWECAKIRPKPWVHFVPFSLNNLEEIEKLINKLENDPILYENIRKKCRDYAKSHLNYNSVLKHVSNVFNNL